MKPRNILFALLAMFLIGFVSCTKKPSPQVVPKNAFPYSPQTEVKVVNEDSIRMAAKLEDKCNVDANLTAIMQSIIKGDCDALAAVTHFPIWRPYPEKDIANKEELKALFHVFFDDKIRRNLKRFTAADWEQVGWRGYMLNNGEYLWADDFGKLSTICYQSAALGKMRKSLYKEELQNIEEASGWIPEICFVAADSSIFIRIEDYDNAKRLHLFFRDTTIQASNLIFNGAAVSEGSGGNISYLFPCDRDMSIEVWTASYSCEDETEIDHAIEFPNYWLLPTEFHNKLVELKPAFWREVKKWW